MTIYEMYHPELREKFVYEHKLTLKDKIRDTEQRIALLEGRQPLKENQAIVRKLKRQLRSLEAEFMKTSKYEERKGE